MRVTACGGVSRRSILVGGVFGGLAMGAGVVGCSSSHDEGAKEKSFWIEAHVGHVSVCYPAGWVEEPSNEDIITKVFTDKTRWMFVGDDYSSDTDPVVTYNRLNNPRAREEGYHPKGYEKITVKGAAKAIKCPVVIEEKGKKRAYSWLLIASLPASIGSTSIVSLRLPTEDTGFVNKVISMMELHE